MPRSHSLVKVWRHGKNTLAVSNHPHSKQVTLLGRAQRALGAKFIALLPITLESKDSKSCVMAVCAKCGTINFKRLSGLFYGVPTSCDFCRLLHRTPQETLLAKKFSAMLSRCNSQDTDDYRFYGARGISVDFGSFDEFKEYMEGEFGDQLYSDGVEIDRVDNNGNYARGNLRLVSHFDNCLNTRRVKHVNYLGRDVPSGHVWHLIRHLIRHDFPWWNCSSGHLRILMIERGMTVPEILLNLPPKSNWRKAADTPPSARVVALYRSQSARTSDRQTGTQP